MATPTIIGGLHFQTKGEAKQFYGDIRNRYPDGVRLRTEDDHLLRELLVYHPEAPEKTGAGVDYFTVDTDAHFGRTRHFTIHRTDGSSTDFSYHSCIDGRNERRDRLGALREAVEEQVISFRDRALASAIAPVCPFRHVPITREAYHVDHTPPAVFVVLVQSWLELAGLTLAQIQISPPR